MTHDFIFSMHLFNRRAGHGSDDSDLGFDPMALEGDLRVPAPEEGPALVPFTADFPPSWAGLPAPDQDAPAYDPVLSRVRDLESRGDWDAALQALDEGIRLRPDDAVLRIGRGALLGRLGRHSESEQELRSALATAPDSVEAELHLGLSLARRGRHTEALPVLQRAFDLDPSRSDVAFHLGEAWLHAGQPEQALRNLMRATELAPGDARAYKLLGRLLDGLGRTEEAMVMHRKAREAGH